MIYAIHTPEDFRWWQIQHYKQRISETINPKALKFLKQTLKNLENGQ